VVLAVLLIVSLTEWALTFSARRVPREPLKSLPSAQLQTAPQTVDTMAIARLFGATAGPAGNIRALGVMAEGASGRGIAIIGIDGQPARTVRAGEPIAPGVLLAEVRRDGVVIERSGARHEIRIATKPPAAGILRAP
jgi:general secretion pathway protein C